MTFILGMLSGMVLLVFVVFVARPRKDWNQIHADRLERQCIAVERIADAMEEKSHDIP